MNVKKVDEFSLKMESFLQQNYGGQDDCTLTSILTLVKYYKPELNDNEAYNYIEQIAVKYLYKENGGTFLGFNSTIIKQVFSHFGINKKVTAKYIKNLGFNINTLINQLKLKKPILITLSNDGRGFYKNHTVTIFGYNIYESIDKKKKIMLKIYDNWTTSVSYLDYDILRPDCSICY